MPTCLELAGATYPGRFNGQSITPLEGRSLVPAFHNQPSDRLAFYWEHEGNRAIRQGRWKLVAKGPAGPWELYDLEADRTELNNLAQRQPDRVRATAGLWEAWARRTHVLPWIWKPAYGQLTLAKPEDRQVPEQDETVVASRTNFLLQAGDRLAGTEAPRLAGRGLRVTVHLEQLAAQEVLVAQGGRAHGFALYLDNGYLKFATRRRTSLTVVASPEPLPSTTGQVEGCLDRNGEVTLKADGRVLARHKTAGLLVQQPADPLEVGCDSQGAVGDYVAPFQFGGRIGQVTLQLD